MRRVGFFLAASLCVALIGKTVSAQKSLTWQSTSSTAWETPGNWLDEGLGLTSTTAPVASDTVVINNTRGATVNPALTAAGQAARKLTVGNGFVLTISGPTAALVVGDSLAGNSDITIQSGAEIDNLSTATSGNPLTLAATSDKFRIDNGGKYLHSTARSFGTPFPASQCDFDSLSTVEFGQASSTAVSLSGRTYGNLTLSATSARSYTASYGGTSTATINGTLTLSSANVTLTLTLTSSAITTIGSLTITNGTLSFGTSTTPLFITGNIINNGTITPGSASQVITLSGNSVQTIAGSSPITFSNLTINNIAGVTLSQNATVAGTLALTGGDVNTGVNTLTLPAAATSTGNADVVGNVRRTGFVSGGSALSFGNPSNVIKIDSGTVPADITVNLLKTGPPGFPTAVQRQYTITPNGGSGLSATLRLHYLDSELNGNDETSASFDLWRFDGTSWTRQAKTASDTSSNWIEKSGVTQFSPWAISSIPSTPTAVALTGFVAASLLDGVALSWESGYEVNNLGYYLYREQNGKRSQVTPSLVAGSALAVGPGSHLAAGSSYSWFDPKGTPDTLYYLEAVDLNGERTTMGPVYPFAGSGNVLSGKRQHSVLLNELTSTSGGYSFEQSWPASMQAADGAATLRFKPRSYGLQQTIAAGQAVKIQVRKTGWYRLSQSELIAAGLDPLVDPRLLQLYVDGEERPLRVSGSGLRLGVDDTIEFYGVALDTPTTDTQTYYLITGNTPGQRISSKRAKVGGNDQVWTERFGSSFAMTTERREKLVYVSNLLNGEAENIFGAVVTTRPVAQSLTLKDLDRETPGQAEVEIALQGFTAQSHQVQVQLNEVVLGTISFASREHPVAHFRADRSILRYGENVISLVSANGESDISLVDWVRLSYAHHYRADKNTLRFSAPGGQPVRVEGFTAPNIRVIDVTNPSSVTELAATVAPAGTGFAVRLRTRGTDTRTLLAFTDEVVEHPALATANRPSGWNASSNAADLVIITPRDFQEAVEPLATLRRSQGLDVALVDIEDVYDEFSYGAHTHLALKAFLSWATSHWRRAPRYLLLVGDSSWDPRNYLNRGYNDFVPTKLIDTAHMEACSDDWLADFDGDGLAEMAVGRLPGRTDAEVRRMVAKILSYEQERQLGGPQRGALLVADRGFEPQNAATRTLLPVNLKVQMINRAEVGDDGITRSQIVEGINQGPLFVNYYGHGSVGVWTGAGLLNPTNAATLMNGNRLSLFVMMTCLNGYAHDAIMDSLGEVLLKAEQGGALAVWASSGFADPDPQVTMAAALYRSLFSADPPRLGEAIRNAKAATTNSDVRLTWLLLGDPTMRLR